MEPVAADLARVAQRLLRDLPAAEAIATAWPLVCGSNVAVKAPIESLQGTVLTVRVPSREWLNELNALRGVYLNKLNELCPAAVTEIKFVT